MILIMGPTGAGKTSQAKQLARRNPRFVHIELGELLRQSDDPKVRQLLNAGELVNDNLVSQIVLDKIAELPPGKVPILDGFPRRMSQVKIFENMITKTRRKIDHVILLKVDRDITEDRLSRRGRLDDVVQAIKRKWQIYLDQTSRVVEHYRQLDLVREVNGKGSVDEVDQRIKTVIGA